MVKQPYERLFGKTPHLQHLKTFGCLCYASNVSPSKTKFDYRAHPSIFIGYPFGQKAYKVFNLVSHSIQITRDIIFYEDIFPYQHAMPADVSTGPDSSLFFEADPTDMLNHLPKSNPPVFDTTTDSHVHLDIPQSDHNIPDILNPNSPSDNSPPATDLSPNIIPETRKSTRPKKKPGYLENYICPIVSKPIPYPIQNYLNLSACTTSFQKFCFAISCDSEPTSYTQAIKNKNWERAMLDELQALESNHTWAIQDLPDGKQPIGCKLGANGSSS